MTTHIRALFVCLLAFSSFAGTVPERISVELENSPRNPFGEPVRIEGPADAACLKYEASTKRLYVGGDHALWVYDAAKPLAPKLLGVCRGIGAPRQLCVQDGIVYVAARETGVWILDAKDPVRPHVLTRFDTVELATGVDVCYPVLFCGQRNYGVEFIDVTDPSRPQHIRVQKTSESQSVVYRDGVLYSGDWGRGELTVIDAHDMSAVRTVRVEKLKGHGDGVDADGRFVFVSTGHHYHDPTRTKEENFGRGHGLEIFDISDDPLRPRFVSRVSFPRFYSLGNDFWTPVACGQTVFCSDTYNGLFAVDMSDPAKPETIGRITARTSRPKKDYDGKEVDLTPVHDVATGEGVVYFAVMRGGLYLTACERAVPHVSHRAVAPRNAGFRADYSTSSKRFDVWHPAKRAQARGVATHRDVIYAACADAGISILRGTPDGGLSEVGRLGARFGGDAKVVGGRLYTAEGFEGVAVYDLADPLKPREVARLRDFGVPVNCALWVWAPLPGWIVVSNRESGYIYLRAGADGSLKPALTCGGCPGWDRYLTDRAVGGTWIGQSAANTGFVWVDVSSDPPKVIRSRVNRGVIMSGNCAFRGDRLLRFPREGGIQYLKPGQAENADGTPWKADAPLRDGRTNVHGQPVWDGADLLALTDRNAKKVTLVDIADEFNPKILWTETTRGDPDASCWWNGRLLVPCGYQGLLVSKTDGEAADETVYAWRGEKVAVWQTDEEGRDEMTSQGFWIEHIFHMANVARSCWVQYLYGGDRDYLAETGYPVILECARYFRNCATYVDSNGLIYIGKFTDLERLGPARERAYMTTCGAVYSLEVAAEAAERLGLADSETADFRETARRLRDSLPVKDGRYLPYPDATEGSVGALSGFFPYPVFRSDATCQRATVDWVFANATSFGNMYPVGKRICPWYAGWMSAVASVCGNRADAFRYLAEAWESAGCFGEYFEINEDPRCYGEGDSSRRHPWFSTGAGNCLYAINQLLVCDADDETRVAFTEPEAWRDFAFRLPCQRACEIACEVRAGKVTRFDVRPLTAEAPELLTPVFRPEILSDVIAKSSHVRRIDSAPNRILVAWCLSL